MIMGEISDNKILQVFREEKELKLSGSLYHELQVRMTYICVISNIARIYSD